MAVEENFNLKREANKLIARTFHELGNKFETGTSELQFEDAMDLIGFLTHVSLSEEQASMMMGMTRRQFDRYSKKHLPKGHHIIGVFNTMHYLADILKAKFANKEKDKGI